MHNDEEPGHQIMQRQQKRAELLRSLLALAIILLMFAGCIEQDLRLKAVYYIVAAVGVAYLLDVRIGRRKRDCCEHCGYSLRGSRNSARCPECGHFTAMAGGDHERPSGE